MSEIKAKRVRLTAVCNRPVTLEGDPADNPIIQRAREKFGDGQPRPFAHEPGSTRKPRERPLLLDWLAKRKP